jgi:predicted acyltransferase
LSLFPHFRFATLRLPGVLVRIGLCYLASVWIFRLTLPAAGPGQDLRHGRRLVAWTAGLTLFYWTAMVLLPWPGHNPGEMTAAGNLGAFIDRAVLGRQHLWGGRPWDPEGLFSTLPAIATTLMGVVAGFWLRAPIAGGPRTLVMAAAGIAAMTIGLLWDLVFPINKSLWTSSYAWFMGGAGAVCLAACYWTVDVRKWRWWTKPFVILGVNAITLFVLSGLMVKTMLLIKVPGGAEKSVSLYTYMYRSWFEPLASPNNASLLFAAANLFVLYVVLWVMYRRKIFLKV